ncbi:hypothetical protein [Clostridium lacusfryxellense]|uniref:hypothetical protein n=1 Tax=Clostridium lacusfryxellense TaxID=205328 RepID=UPI001C0AB6BF|nr:hypothetical protein [Clostridium lacusfryxellense]MBU3114714.1 hypothetical protein [Clostridium lacusfryxellense]
MGINIIIIIVITLVVLTAVAMKTNIFKFKNYNPDFGSLIGGAISGIATLFVIKHTLTIDDRRARDKARVSAGIIKESISNGWNQMNRMAVEGNVKISYIHNWLEYYSDISYVAKYEYLTTLLKEFQYIDTINAYIEQGNKEKIMSTLNEREFYNQNYTGDFNITDTFLNISCIKIGLKESQSWRLENRNITIIKNIEKDLYTVIEETIYNILIEKGDSELNSISIQLIKLVRSYNEFEKVYDNRIIISALLNICIRINKGNRIGFVWNELSLKR